MPKERNYVSKLVEAIAEYDTMIKYHQEVYDMKIVVEQGLRKNPNRDTSYDHIHGASLDKTVEALTAWTRAKSGILEKLPEVKKAYNKKHGKDKVNIWKQPFFKS